jgi:uncharacterized protein
VSRVDARTVAGVASPCIDVCRMDPATGWCEGCLRTIGEIVAWREMGDAEKLSVWDELALRRIDPSRPEPKLQPLPQGEGPAR